MKFVFPPGMRRANLFGKQQTRLFTFFSNTKVTRVTASSNLVLVSSTEDAFSAVEARALDGMFCCWVGLSRADLRRLRPVSFCSIYEQRVIH